MQSMSISAGCGTIVSAYRDKTMDLMFSYPIRRQKILLAKMLVVWLFNFTALSLCKLLLYGGLYVTGRAAGLALQGIGAGGYLQAPLFPPVDTIL